MGQIRAGDAALHYPDGSHRWLSPDGPKEDKAWRALVETHMHAHTRSEDMRPAHRRR